MALVARSIITDGRQSRTVGLECGQRLLAEMGVPPKVVLAWLTILHDQAAFLGGLREVLGSTVPVIGCSTQGVMGRGLVREEGYAASVMGLGGDIDVAVGLVEEVATETRARGRTLGEALRGTGRSPRLVILHWDPITGADVGQLLDGLSEVVGCPVVGGAASHHYEGRMHQTFVYHGDRVLTGAAVALSMGGDFGLEMANCLGCSPLGVEMTVTRAEGNVVLELDGRPALDAWMGVTRSDGSGELSIDPSCVAIGVLTEGATTAEHLVRAAFLLDAEQRGVVVGSAIPAGTRVILHQRTVRDVLDGAEQVGRELKARLDGRKPLAVLGFECGARTGPFLGEEMTLEENLALQRSLAPEAAWAGAMMWGELFPVAGRPGFHNYTYPLVVLAE